MRFAFALVLVGCSSFDPNVGHLQGSQQQDGSADLTDDGGLVASDTDASADGDAVAIEPPPGGVSFQRDIRPLMNRPPTGDPTGKGCKACHYSTQANHIGLDLGGLDLSSLGTLRQGGGSSGRRVVVAGKPDESAIVQKLRGVYPYGSRMPKSGVPYWTDAEIKLVSDWIAQGALGADGE